MKVLSNLKGVFLLDAFAWDDLCLQKEMDEARNVMRELKEERDGIRSQLNAMQVSLACFHATHSLPFSRCIRCFNTRWVTPPPRALCVP